MGARYKPQCHPKTEQTQQIGPDTPTPGSFRSYPFARTSFVRTSSSPFVPCVFREHRDLGRPWLVEARHLGGGCRGPVRRRNFPTRAEPNDPCPADYPGGLAGILVSRRFPCFLTGDVSRVGRGLCEVVNRNSHLICTRKVGVTKPTKPLGCRHCGLGLRC